MFLSQPCNVIMQKKLLIDTCIDKVLLWWYVSSLFLNFVADAKQVTVVVTDGFSGIGPEYIKKRAEEIKARGIEMFAIGITKRINDEELTALSSKPVKNHLVRLTDNKAVEGLVSHIVKEICK